MSDKLFEYRNKTVDYVKGTYEAKYYNSDDKNTIGRDGQHLRFTHEDTTNSEIVEIFPMAKEIKERYSDHFQKSFGKVVYASNNIFGVFKIKYHSNILGKPEEKEMSTSLTMMDYNILYSEKSNQPVQNMVLGNELLNVMNELLDTISSINKEISIHIHPNVGNSPNYRSSVVEEKIESIRKYLPKILSNFNFVN